MTTEINQAWWRVLSNFTTRGYCEKETDSHINGRKPELNGNYSGIIMLLYWVWFSMHYCWDTELREVTIMSVRPAAYSTDEFIAKWTLFCQGREHQESNSWPCACQESAVLLGFLPGPLWLDSYEMGASWRWQVVEAVPCKEILSPAPSFLAGSFFLSASHLSWGQQLYPAVPSAMMSPPHHRFKSYGISWSGTEMSDTWARRNLPLKKLIYIRYFVTAMKSCVM